MLPIPSAEPAAPPRLRAPGWTICPGCKGRGEWQCDAAGADDDGWDHCWDCNGTGSVCDECGAPPEVRDETEGRHRGGCYCHY